VVYDGIWLSLTTRYLPRRTPTSRTLCCCSMPKLNCAGSHDCRVILHPVFLMVGRLVSTAEASLGLLHLCICLAGFTSCLGWWWRSCGLGCCCVFGVVFVTRQESVWVVRVWDACVAFLALGPDGRLSASVWRGVVRGDCALLI
jgi:hypothetical protein